MPPQHSGRYQLLRSLAAGGMAEVFLARIEGAAGFSKLVALKRIHAELADDQSFVERFIDEARLAAGLNHPNIVQIFDLGLADGAYFIAMEYIHGKTLWDLLREASKRRQHLPVDLTLGVLVAACEGLGFAHDLRGPDGKLVGLVHRDVSPQNLLMSFDGAVKVADFGIARAAGRSHKTEAGAIVGKLSYMAPEQMLGKPVDQRTDIYALGVILHELLTGHKLFTATEMDPARRTPPAPPSSINPKVPPAIDAIALRALAPDPADRYPTCDALRADLEAVMAQSGIVNSARRRAELMQAWFPDDRAPPVDPGPQQGAQRSRMPTIQLEKPAFEAAPTVLGSSPFDPRPSADPDATPRPGRAPTSGSAPRRAQTPILAALPATSYDTPLPRARRTRDGRALQLIVVGGVSTILVGAGLFALSRRGVSPSALPVVSAPAASAPTEDAPVAAPRADEPTPATVAVAPARDVPMNELEPRRPEAPRAVVAKKERGALSLTVTPPVQVYQGKTLLGRSPLKAAALPVGKARLRLVAKTEGIDLPLEVEVRPGETVERTVVIGKARLRIKALPWAAVKIDGNDLGQTPLPPQPLYAGTHVVVLAYKPDGAPAKERREQITLKEGEDRLLEADLR